MTVPKTKFLRGPHDEDCLKELQQKYPDMTMEEMISERKKMVENVRKKIPELVCMDDDEVYLMILKSVKKMGW